ncbi:MAG: TonB family protein [Bacteroidia bacterium]|nr:TonB family protein [Bacteroidia bacterium]
MPRKNISALTADLDEMVFTNREKGYGGFYLRKKYPIHLTVGTILIGTLALIMTFGPILRRSIVPDTDIEKLRSIKVTINMDDLPPPPAIDEETPPPPPPPRIKPPEVRTVAFHIPEPAPEDEINPEEEQTIAEVAELKEAPSIGLEDKEGADEGFFTGENVELVQETVPEVIRDAEPPIEAFVFAESEPAPINMDEVKSLIGYPQIARDAGIHGNVVLRILVDKRGVYQRHKVINQVHPLLTEAIEAHIAKLKFTPAIQAGKPIPFWVNVPFSFVLIQ